MRLIIVRHGETEANVNRVLQGHRDNPLSARGREQASQLAERLLSEGVDLLYSSDLKRAKETAEIISARLKLSVTIAPDLRERSYGEFEGRPVTDYERALGSSGLQREAFLPNGGESLVDLETRVREFLAKLTHECVGKTVVVVAHSGTNRALLKLLLRKDFSEWLSIGQDNACLNTFEFTDLEAKAVVINCTAHLGSVGHHPIGAYE